jgi:hypothetical protein
MYSFEQVVRSHKFCANTQSEDGFQLIDYQWSEQTKYKPWIVEKQGKKYRASYLFCFNRFKRHTPHELEMQKKPIKPRRRPKK